MNDKMSKVLIGTAVVLALSAIAGEYSKAEAQVSVFTDPESDAIVFETHSTKTTVEPKFGSTIVTIPSTFGESTYIVSPGGYVTNIYEVDDQ